MLANKQKDKTIRFLMVFVGISGCFSVLFGAWLAHSGATFSTPVLNSVKTGLQYQLFHTLALLVTLVWALSKAPSRLLMAACISFFMGILLFSGSIYLKHCFDFIIVGKLTPFGGILLAGAWVLLAIESIKNL